MRTCSKWVLFLILFSLSLGVINCGKITVKKYYILNYDPEPLATRLHNGPYPYSIRVKEFEIEQAYSKLPIVYRKSPFELQYYHYRVWAVKPTRMISDVIHKHLAATGLVGHVIRRLNEGKSPDYEISGRIEAIEEYDSDEVWFAHLALRIQLVRTKDNRTIYLRHFDRRKQVHIHDPEYVIRELSQIMDYIMTQALHDMDVVLAKEYGITDQPDRNQINDTISFPDLDTLSTGE